MMVWPRTVPLNVNITLGKKIDILSLKSTTIKNFNSNLEKIKESRSYLYGHGGLQKIEKCPVCGFSSKNAIELLEVYGAQYVGCNNCSHCFIKEVPMKKSLDEFYSTDAQYHTSYVDKETIKARIEGVTTPKVQWVVRQYEMAYGRAPKTILDVGTEGGHFVHTCREMGINADGIELSESGRKFCKDNFGIELINKDFIKDWKSLGNYDVITFWGVIEHVSVPVDMLKVAGKMLSRKGGLVVTEVPRWNCFGTAVQSVFFDTIIRHLDPLGHINCFTDKSLATAYELSGFEIVGAWYFGMDAYELIIQLSHMLDDESIINKLGKYIPIFQEKIDSARLSDDMIFAGIPNRGEE